MEAQYIGITACTPWVPPGSHSSANAIMGQKLMVAVVARWWVRGGESFQRDSVEWNRRLRLHRDACKRWTSLENQGASRISRLYFLQTSEYMQIIFFELSKNLVLKDFKITGRCDMHDTAPKFIALQPMVSSKCIYCFHESLVCLLPEKLWTILIIIIAEKGDIDFDYFIFDE